MPECPECGSDLPTVPCPDKKPGCAVLHLGDCPECAKAVQKAWLTTHASAGGKPAIAVLTINNIGFGVRFDKKYDGVGIQAQIGPMRVEELAIIREALDKYWMENFAEICGADLPGGGICQDKSGHYHGH